MSLTGSGGDCEPGGGYKPARAEYDPTRPLRRECFFDPWFCLHSYTFRDIQVATALPLNLSVRLTLCIDFIPQVHLNKKICRDRLVSFLESEEGCTVDEVRDRQ
jgi:hypothetical protein